LFNAADHDLDECRFLLIVKDLFIGSRLFQKQIRHTLPVPYHIIAIDEGVYKVGAMFVKFGFDKELHQVPNQRCIGHTHFPTFCLRLFHVGS